MVVHLRLLFVKNFCVSHLHCPNTYSPSLHGNKVSHGYSIYILFKCQSYTELGILQHCMPRQFDHVFRLPKKLIIGVCLYFFWYTPWRQRGLYIFRIFLVTETLLCCRNVAKLKNCRLRAQLWIHDFFFETGWSTLNYKTCLFIVQSCVIYLLTFCYNNAKIHKCIL